MSIQTQHVVRAKMRFPPTPRLHSVLVLCRHNAQSYRQVISTRRNTSMPQSSVWNIHVVACHLECRDQADVL